MSLSPLQDEPPLTDALMGHAVTNAPRYRDDAAGKPGAEPRAVFAPRTTGECAGILAALQAAGIRAVVQGGRTGLSGGARVQPGEVVVSLERLAEAPTVDRVSCTLTAGAGTVLETAQMAARDEGLFLAADLGARGSATLGGMAATNAGGPLALRYGSFRQQVLGLEAVLPDGTIIRRMGGLLKDNSGYDLGQLLIGSEGTLGVITRLILRLHPLPAERRVAICALPDCASALALLPELRAGLGPGLHACEVMIEPLLSEACASRDMRYPFDALAPAVLLIEAAGQQGHAAGDALEALLSAALETGKIADAVLSMSEKDCQRLWSLREACSHHLIELGSPITSLDLSLPVAAIPVFLDEAEHLMAGRDRARIFGHLGDGNLHYILTGDQDDAAVEAIFTLLARHGGVITAEHGVGADKVGWLPLCRPTGELDAMARLKAALDPGWILNRDRVLKAPPQISESRRETP